MPTPELRDIIENELRRVLIQNHPNFAAWHALLGSHGQEVVDNILEDDVTAELIRFAQESPDEEWNDFQFLRMTGAGNPDSAITSTLTNSVLGGILDEVRKFEKTQD